MRALTWRAAVAVIVLVAGGCGSGEGSGGDGLRRLPIGMAGGGGAGGGDKASAAMAAEADVASDGSARMTAPVQTIEYRLADDASAAPEKGEAYEVKPLVAGGVGSKIAKALGVDVELVEVGAGGFDWSYNREDPDVTASSSAVAPAPACAPDEKCIDAGVADDQLEVEAEEAPSPPETPVQGVLDADEAEARVRKFLSALGASDDGTFETFGGPGTDQTSVLYTPDVGGIPIPEFTTEIVFGENGRIEYGYGMLAKAEGIGEYPLVGLAEAVERLKNGFGDGGGVATLGVEEDSAPSAQETDPAEGEAVVGSTGSAGATSGGAVGGSGSCAGASGGGSDGSGGVAPDSGTASAEPCSDVASPTPACAADEPCSTPPSPPIDEPSVPIEPVEPQMVEITGAELTLQLVSAGCPGDAMYLVPTFELQTENGTWGFVIAVEDDAIAGQGSDADGDQGFQPCPDQGDPDVPVGKPEPAPMPADTGREPANP